MSRCLRRYRLVCTDKGSSRCRWASPSWTSSSPARVPELVTMSALDHVRGFHPERDDVFDNPCEVRRYRPALHWAALIIGLAAALLALTLAALTIDPSVGWPSVGWPNG